MEGASHQDEFIYDTEFVALAEEHDFVEFVATISRPQAERNQGWTGATGRVNLLVEEYLAKWSLPKDDTLIYLCGNPGMIEWVTDSLGDEGWNVDSERFWKEEEGE